MPGEFHLKQSSVVFSACITTVVDTIKTHPARNRLYSRRWAEARLPHHDICPIRRQIPTVPPPSVSLFPSFLHTFSLFTHTARTNKIFRQKTPRRGRARADTNRRRHCRHSVSGKHGTRKYNRTRFAEAKKKTQNVSAVSSDSPERGRRRLALRKHALGHHAVLADEVGHHVPLTCPPETRQAAPK